MSDRMTKQLLPIIATVLAATQEPQHKYYDKDRKESKSHRKLRLARKKKRRSK